MPRLPHRPAFHRWTALLAPAKTPRAIVNQLHREVTRIFRLPDVQQRMTAIAADVTLIAPEEVDRMVAGEVKLTADLARQAGIRAE
ncbi:MAG: hypothetical protein IT531_25020 [Burkholderiales bacterium]|nr:hypothetical protein [Burkholderiales bacterium]